MKFSIKSIISVIVLVIVLSLFVASIYITQETEQAIITQFGKIKGTPVTKAGLHLKIPFIQKINILEKRILEWDGKPNQIPTKDKLFIYVDTFARWRISDTKLYFQRLRNEISAQSRLDDILDGETRNAIANNELLEIIRSSNREPAQDESLDAVADLVSLKPIKVGREKIMREIFENASPRLTDLGIELLDIRFKRINYSEDVQSKIYDRMISERKQIAERFRSEGHGEAARILGGKDRELKQITSAAYKQIQQIQGEADAKATEIYAAAYNKSSDSQEFYQFLKTMETYRATLDQDVMMILSTDGEFFKFLKGTGKGDSVIR